MFISYSSLTILVIVSINHIPCLVDSRCIKIFSSKGTFESPIREDHNLQPLIEDANDDPSSEKSKNNNNKTTTDSTTHPSINQFKPIHCLYKFIGQKNERVVLNFTSFRLRGVEPECNREYVDIYAKFKPEDDIDSLIGQESSNGRFCSSVIPRRIISLHNMILLIIHSELRLPSSSNKQRVSLFEGKFEFIKTKSYDQIGPPIEGTACNHVIRSSERRDGEFQSITYPGVYSKGLDCSYQFIGNTKQRIRLEFLDLDLYSGGSHCPLDSVKVFDGLEETDPIIQAICGSHRSLIIFSTLENLLVTFVTLERESEVQNRGFSAYFEFSDNFVNPDFIGRGSDARHIRGSECDQRIVSSRASSGLVRSPGWGHHSNAICRYVFEGLQTSLDYERVVLRFRSFDLKGSSITTSNQQMSTNNNTNNSNININNNQSTTQQQINTTSDQCSDNYVRLYTAEQKPDQKQDPNDYDYSFCGTELPQTVESDAASLLMEYNSGTMENASFEAEYKFVVDFRIPGSQNGSGCDYVYKSDLMKTGTFNSPRHPSWYINDLNCTYKFITKPSEVLLIQFITFKMSSSYDETKILGYNEACHGQDRAEIYELNYGGAGESTGQLVTNYPNNQVNSPDQPLLSVRQSGSIGNMLVEQSLEIGTYCGITTPGPILSYMPMRINFITNKDRVHYGFWAIYNFHQISELKTNEFVTNCGGYITASQKLKTGNFTSPETYRPETYEKRNHICSWTIAARPSYRIALNFTRFQLEGSPYVRGCITASIRITTKRFGPPVELCGSWTPSTNLSSSHQFISDSEMLSITFISTKLASGSTGFSATWLEVRR